MRTTGLAMFWVGLSALAACEMNEAADDSSRDLLAAKGGDAAVSARPKRDAGAVITVLSDAGADGGELVCPRGGETGPIRVLFACDGITVITCKDLSNVVIELADGSRQRVEGLNGHQNGFAAPGGVPIVGVWVKAGSNHSGDGPGYGERFDAPELVCTDAGAPPPPPPPPPGDQPPKPPVTVPPIG